MAKTAGNGESVESYYRQHTGAVCGGMPVEGMVGLAVAAGVMVEVGIVQFRRTGV